MSEKSVENHYLSLLLPAFREHADKPVFRPYIGKVDAWDTVTYRGLEQRLVVAQAHWKKALATLQLKTLDIVGFWLTGRKVTDLVNTIAISSLGYTPQFFSGYFSGFSVVIELLVKSGGKAIIIDKSFQPQVSEYGTVPVPSFDALEDAELLAAISAAEGPNALQFAVDSEAAIGLDDYAALFHSSGTTGGMPKIIPNTYKMIRAVILYKHSGAQDPDKEFLANGGGQTVANTLGSLAHIASFHTFLGAIHTGACLAQSSSMAVSPQEFLGLVQVCGLTRLILYATFLSEIIRAAKKDETIRDGLKGLRQIFHTGVALNKEDEAWAYENGLRMITSYSTTETAPLLRSRVGLDPSARLLRPVRGANPAFLPYKDKDSGSTDADLYEVVVPADADDCPPPSLVAADGFYHSNDIFEKVEDGWVYRGRAGDWIKVLGGFVDTKSIEDNVRKTCEGLVHDTVVIGSGRTAPVLVVESTESALDVPAQAVLVHTIIERTAEFNKRAFAHERIEDPKRILVVDRGTLPRTKEKGNVRRGATEELLATELDAALADA
ncbi:acetyl-CoA synthetase-like protein [Trametes versicolor FP-101664 SS1]|uniref:acetyl-CoA synthetase-like protein n=1 Tax=Trametes versicolor (strain FP-101664) TaxID=717944 RepID=UPI0004623B7A|nr:acetyl-CoA synthetase-like protein [Trametes versicolor FP-101664 SS1]EIW55359.1 acetyl-CoA synthetase-like protein [Trametes versicolor FP-101664 SS1]